MALHTIVEHDTTHIKPYIDNVKQALSDYINNYGVKNLWDIDKYHTMSYEFGASSTYANGVFTISCPSGGGGYFTFQNMKSWFDAYKGMPLVMTYDVKAEADNVPGLMGMFGALQSVTLGTTYQTIVVPISDVIYLHHIVIETSDHENAHTLTATNFMLTPASWYEDDSDFEPFAMTNQQLTMKRESTAVSGIDVIYNNQECIVDFSGANIGSVGNSWVTAVTINQKPTHQLYFIVVDATKFTYLLVVNTDGTIQLLSMDGSAHNLALRTQIRFTWI